MYLAIDVSPFLIFKISFLLFFIISMKIWFTFRSSFLSVVYFSVKKFVISVNVLFDTLEVCNKIINILKQTKYQFLFTRLKIIKCVHYEPKWRFCLTSKIVTGASQRKIVGPHLNEVTTFPTVTILHANKATCIPSRRRSMFSFLNLILTYIRMRMPYLLATNFLITFHFDHLPTKFVLDSDCVYWIFCLYSSCLVISNIPTNN